MSAANSIIFRGYYDIIILLILYLLLIRYTTHPIDSAPVYNIKKRIAQSKAANIASVCSNLAWQTIIIIIPNALGCYVHGRDCHRSLPSPPLYRHRANHLSSTLFYHRSAACSYRLTYLIDITLLTDDFMIRQSRVLRRQGAEKNPNNNQREKAVCQDIRALLCVWFG